MQPMAKALLRRILGRRWSAVTFGPRLATLGARPVDRVRLLIVGALLPVLERVHTVPDRRLHVRVKLEGSTFPITLQDRSDYGVLAASRGGDEIPDFVEAPRTIIDCGAHIGTVALQYRARFPGATIYAVEPDPATVERLRYNLGTTKDVTVIQAAVGGKTGSSDFFQSEHSWASSLTPPLHEPLNGHTVVSTLTLSALLDHCGGGEVDLLKLDIEGAELNVLEDSQGLSRVRAIIGEIHYDLGGFTEHDLMAKLADFDAQVVPHAVGRALLRARRVTPSG